MDKLMNNSPSRLYDELMAQEALIDAEKKKTQGKPNITPLQINSKGELDEAKSLALENSVKPLTFADRLLGRTLTKDTQVTNPETGETKLETYSNYRPGLLTDFAAGMNENYSQDFKPANLKNNTGDYGDKGFAYRLGEGFGSFSKFLESPLGRSLLVGGIVGATGGDGLQALTYGAQTGMLNQSNRMKDQLYRNSLEQQGIDTTGVRGFVNDDVYKNLSLNNYRNKGLDVKLQLETLKDTTKRAQLVNIMLNSGELDPTTAMGLMNQYGINITDLDTSNQTKLLPYRQYALKNGWNLGWANFGLKQEAADLKNQILKELTGETGKTQTVRVKSPDGKIGTIPIEQLKGAEEAGYQRL